MAKSQGRGAYAKDVVAALAKDALAVGAAVSLTVKTDNASAIAAYEREGFRAQERRIWGDHGVGAAP
jgi:predicted GNAT family acetyltransferase